MTDEATNTAMRELEAFNERPPSSPSQCLAAAIAVGPPGFIPPLALLIHVATDLLMAKKIDSDTYLRIVDGDEEALAPFIERPTEPPSDG